MKVFVKTLKGTNFEIEVNPEDTTLDVFRWPLTTTVTVSKTVTSTTTSLQFLLPVAPSHHSLCLPLPLALPSISGLTSIPAAPVQQTRRRRKCLHHLKPSPLFPMVIFGPVNNWITVSPGYKEQKLDYGFNRIQGAKIRRFHINGYEADSDQSGVWADATMIMVTIWKRENMRLVVFDDHHGYCAGYNASYVNPEVGYAGNPYPASYGMNPMNPVQASGESYPHYGPGTGAWGAYDAQRAQGQR